MYIAGSVSEAVMESQARGLLDHTWAVWEYPAHPYGWKHGIEAAVKHVIASTANWSKFRKDLVDKLMLVGLPKPQEPDAKNEWAREQAAAFMDRAIAEVHKRMVDTKCAGCGQRRNLQPMNPTAIFAGKR